MWAAVFVGWSTAVAGPCPDGWTTAGCSKPDDGCCPTREACEQEVQLETKAAVRRHLGAEYDERMARYDAAWAITQDAARACIVDLDLLSCNDAEQALRTYLGMERRVRFHPAGGNATVQTSCGPERVFFDARPISYEAPHMDTATGMLQELEQLVRGIVANPTMAKAGRPAPGVPARPSGGGSPDGLLRVRALFVEHGPIDDVLGPIRTNRGRLDACYRAVHPDWRNQPGLMVVRWIVSEGRAREVLAVRNDVGSVKLAGCVQRVIADIPFRRATDGRVSATLSAADR